MRAVRLSHIVTCLLLGIAAITPGHPPGFEELPPVLKEAAGATGGLYHQAILEKYGYAAETDKALRVAAKQGEPTSVRRSALLLLAVRVGKDGVAAFKEALLDEELRVRATAARLLGAFGDKSGVDVMRRDLAALAPRHGAPDPNEAKRDRYFRLSNALEAAGALCEIGDASGLEFVAFMAMKGERVLQRRAAVYALINLAILAESDASILAGHTTHPASVLVSVAESETDRSVLRALEQRVGKLPTATRATVQEKLDASPYLAGPGDSIWKRVEISDGWRIKSVAPRASLDADFLVAAERAAGGIGWLPAVSMPAMVPEILMQNGQIDAPWLPGRAQQYQWIAEHDWVYVVRFNAAEPQAESWLHFKGLDTIVDVYLNGQRIASHENMYLPLRVNVTGHLRELNTLALHLHSVYEKNSDGKRSVIRSVDGDPDRRVRRANQNYGNYLGPYPNFSRVGVYDKIFLEVTHGTELTEVVVGASLDEAWTMGTVELHVRGTTILDRYGLDIRLIDPNGKPGSVTGFTRSADGGVIDFRTTLQVFRPRLWWPRGYGDQPLYRVEVALMGADGRPHQTVSRTIGFRRVTMSQRLHFVVNDVPVRLWGGDWVTPHWHTAVWDPPRVEKLFAMAEHAHFNAFRVWGVVESPRDDFYEMADQRGFLLWQDFTDLPLRSDDRSKTICREETTQLVKRLKYHPSIVVWCGGNENAMWHHQEFNGQLEDRGPWRGLEAAEVVGQVCRELDADRYYQPSSPYFGENPNDPQEGNTHGYTNMWFVPGYDYLNFASEDTRIAAPPLHSLRRFMAPEDIWPEDYSPLYTHGDIYPFPKSWLRYTTGSSWKKTGPVELFYDATDAASLVHRLGMAEALYYQDTIERQRRGRDATDPTNRRRCGGYLVWKYNDSWPHIYSGKVDYFLEPYHVYYTLRRAYAPVLLSFDKGAYIYLWVVNDTRQAVSGKVTIQLLHLDRNQVRKEVVREVTVPPGESKVVLRLDEAGIGTFRKEHVLYASLTDASGHVIATAHCLGDIERRVRFADAKLDVAVRDGALAITSDKYARTVTLEGDAGGDAFGWFFEDNYFDLMPGEEKTVRVLGDHAQGRVTIKAWYSPHVTTIHWER